MNDKLHIADTDLALYAMGALSAAEMEPIKAHLLACARCTEELRQNTLALAAYAQTTPEVAVPEGAKDRFLSQLSRTPQTYSVVPAQPQKAASFWGTFFGSGPARWSPALAGAFAVLLLLVGIDDFRKRAEIEPLLKQAQRGAIDSAQLAQLMDLLTSPQAKKVALHTAPVAAPPPEGRVVYAARTGKLLLTASNLHPLPAGKVYELWILQPGGKKPLPAGTFAPDSAGYATMILADAPEGLAVQGFGVTIENAGGSETPTLPIVLSGF
jgi:Anti-sigma-K factor rskA/Putative zinc-finger